MATERLLFGLVMASITTVMVNAQSSPVLDVPNLVVTLYEDYNAIKILDTYTCADVNDLVTSQPTVASIAYSPLTGCPSCLRLEPKTGGTNEYELKFYPAVATFDFTVTPTYFVTVTCTDNTDPDATANVEVRLVPNSYPTFDLGLAVTETLASTRSVVAGGTVYQVLATDPNAADGDIVFYTMTMVPTTASFEIGYASGLITATSDLESDCISEVTFTVTITDNKLTNPNNQVIVMTLAGYNTQPVITASPSLPHTALFDENQAANTLLLTMDKTDDDIFTFVNIYTNPPEALNLFQQDDASLTVTDIRVGTDTWDYEDLVTRVTEVIITIDDLKCPISTYSWTVSITDVNEDPVIDPLDVSYELYEGNIVLDPQWTTTDPDDGDTLTYSIKTMNPAGQPYQIDASTGVITSTQEIDLEAGGQATVTFTIEVTDSGGLTSDTTLILNLKDSNDNAPEFDAASLNLYFTPTTCIPPTIKWWDLTATDADSAFQDNNVISFHLATPSSNIAVSESGEVLLLSLPGGGVVGSSETVKIDAIDAGQYPGNLTSIVAAEVTFTVAECTTTAAVTTTAASAATTSGFSWEDNIWWIAFAGLFTILALALLTWFCISRIFPFCRNPPPGHWSVAKLKCCKRSPPQPKQPKKPKKTFKDMVNKVKPITVGKPKPGNDGFWKVVQDVINKPSPLSDSDRGPDRFKGPQGHDANNVHDPKKVAALDDPLHVNRAYQEGFF